MKTLTTGLALALTLISVGANAAKVPAAKTLSCEAETLTNMSSDGMEKTQFSVMLKEDNTQIPPSPAHKIYSFRDANAFKSKDGRFTIGLQAQQPLNDKLFKYDLVTVWAVDNQTGFTAQAGGGMVFNYKSNIDHQYLNMGPNSAVGGNFQKGDEFLYVNCDLK